MLVFLVTQFLLLTKKVSLKAMQPLGVNETRRLASRLQLSGGLTRASQLVQGARDAMSCPRAQSRRKVQGLSQPNLMFRGSPWGGDT